MPRPPPAASPTPIPPLGRQPPSGHPDGLANGDWRLLWSSHSAATGHSDRRRRHPRGPDRDPLRSAAPALTWRHAAAPIPPSLAPSHRPGFASRGHPGPVSQPPARCPPGARLKEPRPAAAARGVDALARQRTDRSPCVCRLRLPLPGHAQVAAQQCCCMHVTFV